MSTLEFSVAYGLSKLNTYKKIGIRRLQKLANGVYVICCDIFMLVAFAIVAIDHCMTGYHDVLIVFLRNENNSRVIAFISKKLETCKGTYQHVSRRG